MRFRSHVARSLDLDLWSNRLMLGLAAVAGLAALAVILTGGVLDVWIAPVHVFLTWAFVREVDPDHEWTALAAAFVAGLWVIVGLEVMSAFALLGLMVAARLVLNSTGRRPLVTDLIGLVVIAAAIAFTPEGWIAGFALAIAVFIDTELAGTPTTAEVIAAAVAAMGVAAVATLTNAVPESFPDIRPLLTVLVGAVALLAIVREPVQPLSVTDSRDRRLLEARRLHAARSLVGVTLFLSALLMGPASVGLVPTLTAFALGLASGERDRLVRAMNYRR